MMTFVSDVKRGEVSNFSQETRKTCHYFAVTIELCCFTKCHICVRAYYSGHGFVSLSRAELRDYHYNP